MGLQCQDIKLKKKKLAKIISRALFWTAIFTVIISLAVSAGIMFRDAYEEASNLLKGNVEDVSLDISDEFMDNNIKKAETVEEAVWKYIYYIKRSSASEATDYLNVILSTHDCDEINIVDEDGIVSSSSRSSNIGIDFHDSERTEVFLKLLEGEKSYAQEPRRGLSDPEVMMIYAGASFPDKSGFVQVGSDMETFEKVVIAELPKSIRNRRIGEDGFLMVYNSADHLVVADSRSRYTGRSLVQYKEDMEQAKMNESVFMLVFDDELEMLYLTEVYGYYIIGVYPVLSAFKSALINLLGIFVIETSLFLIVFVIIYTFLKKRVIKEVVDISASLERIAGGDLTERVDAKDTVEFDALSDSINATVDKLREAAENETERLDKELEFAGSIRKSSLPMLFPAFPERKEFGIYGLLEPAKENGRDFYDFYMVSDEKIAFLIVDIMGKSTAATTTFMIAIKTMLKSLTESGLAVNKAFSEANRILQEEADFTGMYLTATAFMGILELKTGCVRYANAGHFVPAILSGGKAEYVDTKPDIMLCAREDYEYEEQVLYLNPGDMLLLYTDGCIEARDERGDHYGKERLLKALEDTSSELPVPFEPNAASKEACLKVKDAVVKHMNNTEPKDDITMVCIGFKGEERE